MQDELEEKSGESFDWKRYAKVIRRRRWYFLLPLFFGWLIVAHFKPPIPGYETGFVSEDLLYGALGLLVVICSGCYWTLHSRQNHNLDYRR